MRTNHSFINILAVLLCVGSGVGCENGVPPQAGISDPAVFTTLHLLAAEASTDLEGGKDVSSLNNGPFTAAQMKRYFESKASDYPTKKLHADELLDNVQGQSAVFQAFQSQLSAALAVNFAQATTSGAGAAAASSTPAGTTPAGGSAGAGGTQPAAAPASPTANLPPAPTPNSTTSQLEDTAKAAFTAMLSAQAPTDSPFDQLDRVADFYAAYVLKNLRLRGDSRVIDNQTIIKSLEQVDKDPLLQTAVAGIGNVTGSKDLNRDRMLLLVFQTHIDPGTRANTWTGIRLKFDEADNVRIIRLHPTHTYDVDMEDYGSAVSSSFAGSVSASGGYAGIQASQDLALSELRETQERRRFLSRISKATSFADAANHVVGFNFYPSDVTVTQTPFLMQLFSGQQFEVKGYLEGGGRECALLVIVPRSKQSLTINVSYVWGSINGDEVNDGPAAQPLTVTLPDWDPVELLAASLGAAPTRYAAGTPAALPSADSGPAQKPAQIINEHSQPAAP
jgi:hypothetical protein